MTEKVSIFSNESLKITITACIIKKGEEERCPKALKYNKKHLKTVSYLKSRQIIRKYDAIMQTKKDKFKYQTKNMMKNLKNIYTDRSDPH